MRRHGRAGRRGRVPANQELFRAAMTIRAVFEYDPVDHYQAARAVTRLTPVGHMGWATEREFLFFYNRQCAYYLPKRVLSPEQVAGVRELMRSALGARAHLQAA